MISSFCKTLTLGLALALGYVCDPVPTQAAIVVSTCGTLPATLPSGSTGRDVYIDVNGTLCTAAASVSVGGFQPAGSFASLTATNVSSASTALPSGSATRITNNGSTAVSCTLATGAATGVASNIMVQPSSSVVRVKGSFDHIACIDQTGSASNQVVLEGGSGLGNDSGGGGGGSGGGGAVSIASGQVASGAYSSGSIASGAYASGSIASGAYASGSIGTGAFASGSIGSGAVASGAYASGSISSGAYAAGSIASGAIASGAMVDLGTQADAACATDNGSCTLIALQKRSNQNVTTLNTTAAAPVTTNDPCTSAVAKTTKPFSQTAGAVLIAGVSAKKTYICSMKLIAGAAEIYNIVEGTGSVCATGIAALAGSTTAANGLSLAANGGITYGNGAAAVINSATAADDVCLTQSGSSRLSGSLTFVQI